MVLRLPSVACKRCFKKVFRRFTNADIFRYLTCKVDRSVTGLIAQQQCVGPLHTPLADVAVVALSHFDTVIFNMMNLIPLGEPIYCFSPKLGPISRFFFYNFSLAFSRLSAKFSEITEQVKNCDRCQMVLLDSAPYHCVTVVLPYSPTKDRCLGEKRSERTVESERAKEKLEK